MCCLFRRSRNVALGAAASAALGLGAGVSCASSWATEGLGAYSDFRPYARVAGSSYDIELDRPGYVAILSIAPPLPSEDPRQFYTFRPLYPATEADTGIIASGKQRVWNRQAIVPMPRLCVGDQIPSMNGCRMTRRGVGRFGDAGRIPDHYLMVVSEVPIDPYTLAFFLEEARASSESLAEALLNRDARTASREITEVIASLPGSPNWAGYYVVRR